MISLIQQREEQAAERCHAGSQHHAILPALQRCDSLLQILLIGAAVAGVEIAAGAGPIHIRGIIGQGIAVGHGDGPLDSAAVLVNVISRVNRPGGKAVVWTESVIFHVFSFLCEYHGIFPQVLLWWVKLYF